MQISSRYNSNIPFILIAGLSLSYVLSLFLLQLFGALLFIIWIFEKNSEKKKAFDQLTAIVIVFGIIRLLAILFSEYHSLSIESLYKEALFYLSFFALSFYLKSYDENRLSEVVFYFILGALVNSIIGLIRFNLGVDARTQSFSSGYAAFSSYILAVFGLALFNRKSILKSRSFILWGFILSVMLSAIVTSLGRTNIALAVFAIFIALILRKLDFRTAIITILMAAAVSFISFQNNDVSSLQNRIESPAQLSDRDILIKGAGEIALEHPILGFGPRTFQEIFPYKDKFSDKGIGSWHNDFIQIYFESGILGLLTYILLLAYIVYASIIVIRSRSLSYEYKKIAAGITAAIFLLVLSGLTAGFITSPVLSIVFAFLISSLASVRYKSLIKVEP